MFRKIEISTLILFLICSCSIAFSNDFFGFEELQVLQRKSIRSEGLSVLLQITNPGCDGNSDSGVIDLTISGGVEPYVISWAGGQSTEDIYNLSAGWYYYTITDASVPQLELVDSVELVEQIPPFLDFPGRNLLCSNDTIVLDALNSGSEYLWSTGETTQTIEVWMPGEYFVTVTNLCGSFVESVFLTNDESDIFIQLPNDTTLCAGESIVLEAGNLNSVYYWSNGSFNQTIEVVDEQTIWLKVYNCKYIEYDSINVFFVSPLQNEIFLDDTTLCVGEVLALEVSNSDVEEVIWSTGEISSEIFIENSGVYWVSVSNQCGSEVDSIFVDFMPVLNDFDLGPDTVLCSGNELLLNVNNPLASIVWSTGETASSIVVSSSGEYSVIVSNYCGEMLDTINVDYQMIIGDSISLGEDQLICIYDTLVLDPGVFDASYLWSTGDTTQTISVFAEGLYSVTLSNVCGSLVDEMYLSVDSLLNDIELGNDTVICEGEEIILDANNLDGQVLWSNGSDSQSIIVDNGVTVSVTVSNVCEIKTDTIEISMIESLLPIDLGGIIFICGQDSLILDGGLQDADYQWSTGDTTQTITVFEDGRFSLTLTNYCGAVTDQVSVYFADTLPELELGEDLILCAGDTVLLDAGMHGGFYLWSNGETSQSIEVVEQGMYSLTITNACGMISDSVFVTFMDTALVIIEDETGSVVNHFCVESDVSIEIKNVIQDEYMWIGPKGCLYGEKIEIKGLRPEDAGEYIFLLDSDNPCVDTVVSGSGNPSGSIVVQEMPDISVSVIHESCFPANDGMILCDYLQPHDLWEFNVFYFQDSIGASGCSLGAGCIQDSIDSAIVYDLKPGNYVYLFLSGYCTIYDTLNVRYGSELCDRNTLYIPDAFTDHKNIRED